MHTRQVRIFVPESLETLVWAETVLGRIVRPFVQREKPKWFWFSRYDIPPELDANDCVIAKIPLGFLRKDRYRSLRFRYCVRSLGCEKRLMREIERAGFWASDCREYDPVKDLGQDHYVEPPRTEKRKRERSLLCINTYHSMGRLLMHCLQGPDEQGNYWLPHHENDTTKTVLMQVRHIYLNSMLGPWERPPCEWKPYI